MVQSENLGAKFDINGDEVRDVADMVVDSFEVELAQSEDHLVSIILIYLENSFKVLGC